MEGSGARFSRAEEYFRTLVEHRQIVGLCRAGAAATRMGETAAAAHGLGLTQFLVLGMLAGAGPGSQQELSEGVRTDRTTMVGTVDALERAGLVVRERNPTDRRAYIITITDSGRAALKAVESEAGALEEAFFEPLTAGERAQLVVLLTKLLFPAAR
ncbi:MAG: MarR family transcriptional regulator [Actinobacteria bacterium]|nr:MarR family transcriptional regulator [Actinomycetota bacterium]MBI3687292.1 MarR family transcriptional regulator [Actinomycetota bacterium]